MTDTQTQKFIENWKANHAQFGQKNWDQEPDFCHYIHTPIPLDIATKLCQAASVMRQQLSLKDGSWLKPEDLHLTITLPGRLGSHFQKNDLSFMKKTLQAITAETPAFEVQIKNFNVFPHSLFAEVHDHTGRLQQLHETLCNEIPFSQHPEFRYQHYLPHISLAYGVQSPQVLPADTDREFEALTFNLNTINLGKAKWQGNTLKKTLAAEFTLK